MNTEEQNQRFITLMSYYLNLSPTFIDEQLIDELTFGLEGGEETAYRAALANALGLDITKNGADREFYRKYFIPSVKMLDPAEFECDLYYRNIKPKGVKFGSWEIKKLSYKPYELFVCGDFEYLPDGTVLPKLGFFKKEFEYTAILENGVEWMTITPNEITTMREPCSAAYGRVLTYGLGCGYFAYLASLKDEVECVNVVEKSRSAIELFKNTILPLMHTKNKINIIECDALDYAREHIKNEKYDFVFVDLWHDVSDGAELYIEMKRYEKNCPEAKYSYWIEKTMRYYL